MAVVGMQVSWQTPRRDWQEYTEHQHRITRILRQRQAPDDVIRHALLEIEQHNAKPTVLETTYGVVIERHGQSLLVATEENNLAWHRARDLTIECSTMRAKLSLLREAHE